MNKYDTVLFLKSPKLFTDIIAYSGKNEYKVTMPDAIDKDLSFTLRNEPINREHYREVDFIAGKKTKQKSKKKLKNTLHFEDSSAHTKKDLDFNEKTLIRNTKNLKHKKTYKENYEEYNNNKVNQEKNSQDVYLDDLLTVHELALKLNVSTADIIKWLFLQGISVTINQLLDLSISTLVAKHYSFNILDKPVLNIEELISPQREEKGKLRAPVITLLGHVDHGKTSLLRAIRKDYKFTKEAGNITQSIGSYEIFIHDKLSSKKLIFLDTPGHEAFVSMRERGASITDLVILVVAADDGLQPQTIEAIGHIQSRKLPFLVAINKIDKQEANVSKVEKQLLEFGIDNSEGNNAQKIIQISSLHGDNISSLLSSIVNLCKIYQWKSDPSQPAKGAIIEAYLNKQKGPIAQLLIKDGKLHVGDIIVAGNFYGKVKAIYNSMNENVKSVESASLADVLCFTQVPRAGLSFIVVETEKEAKILINKYAQSNNKNIRLNSRISLDDLSLQGAKTIIKQINLIIKTDTISSIEAISYALSKVPQEKVQLNLLTAACGEVSIKDIDLAVTSHSMILAFGLNVSSSALHYAEDKKIQVEKFKVIYDLVEYVRQQMLKFIDVEYKRKNLGFGQVKSLFNINRGVVAGCFVQSGKLKRGAYFQLKRGNEKVYAGLIDSLKQIKDDAEEVKEGNECGILCKDYNLWEVGDILDCYELQALEKTL